MDQYDARRFARIERKVEAIFGICASGISFGIADRAAPSLAAELGWEWRTAFGLILIVASIVIWMVSREAFSGD